MGPFDHPTPCPDAARQLRRQGGDSVLPCSLPGAGAEFSAGCSLLRDWRGPFFRSFRHSHDAVAAHVAHDLCRGKPHRDFRTVQAGGVTPIRISAVPYQQVERPVGIVFGREHERRPSGCRIPVGRIRVRAVPQEQFHDTDQFREGVPADLFFDHRRNERFEHFGIPGDFAQLGQSPPVAENAGHRNAVAAQDLPFNRVRIGLERPVQVAVEHSRVPHHADLRHRRIERRFVDDVAPQVGAGAHGQEILNDVRLPEFDGAKEGRDTLFRRNAVEGGFRMPMPEKGIQHPAVAGSCRLLDRAEQGGAAGLVQLVDGSAL